MCRWRGCGRSCDYCHLTFLKFYRIFNSIKKLVYIFILFPFLLKAQGIVVGDTISPNVIYNNIKDTTIDQPGMFPANCDVDFNNDATFDMRFSCQKQSSPSFSATFRLVSNLSSIEFACTTTSFSSSCMGYTIYYADTCAYNTLINNSLKWTSQSVYFEDTYGSVPYTSFCAKGLYGGVDKYMGFRKTTPNDTIYGWFFLHLNALPNNQMQIILKSYAYEKSPVGIKENGLIENSVLIFPNPTAEKLSIKNKSNKRIDQTKLYSTDGRAIDLMRLDENVYDVSSFPEGIYILQLKFENNILNKKIAIQR